MIDSIIKSLIYLITHWAQDHIQIIISTLTNPLWAGNYSHYTGVESEAERSKAPCPRYPDGRTGIWKQDAWFQRWGLLWHSVPSRSNIHVYVKTHDKELSKCRGRHSGNHAPINFRRRSWVPIRVAIDGLVEGKAKPHGNTQRSGSEVSFK